MSHKMPAIDVFYEQIMSKVIEEVRSQFNEEGVPEEYINLLKSVNLF